MARFEIIYTHQGYHDGPDGEHAIYRLEKDGVVIMQETLYMLGIEFVRSVGNDTDTFVDREACETVAELRRQYKARKGWA